MKIYLAALGEIGFANFPSPNLLSCFISPQAYFILRSKKYFHCFSLRIISPQWYFLLRSKIYFYCVSLQNTSFILFPTNYFNKVYLAQTLKGIA